MILLSQQQRTTEIQGERKIKENQVETEAVGVAFWPDLTQYVT